MDHLLSGSVEYVMVGSDFSANDRLAESPTGLDNHVILPSVGVSREEDPADARVDHLLDEDGEAHRALVESLAVSVDENSRGEERTPALAHRRDHLVRPGNVEVSVLQAGERRPLEVFRCGARTNRAEPDRELSNERFVGRLELLLEGGREWEGFERLTDPLRSGLDRAGLLGADRFESRRKFRLEIGLVDERLIGLGRQNEPRWNRQSFSYELAELTGFPSDKREVGLRNLREGHDERHRYGFTPPSRARRRRGRSRESTGARPVRRPAQTLRPVRASSRARPLSLPAPSLG